VQQTSRATTPSASTSIGATAAACSPRPAEELAADTGYSKLAVISGIGVREYYRNKLIIARTGRT